MEEIKRALQIATREWENIKISLAGYGDIGEFHSKNHARSRLDSFLVSEGLILVRNFIRMENKIPTYGYLTQEAAYAFTYLASRAAERLGLKGAMAQTFGRGYSWVRTGWFEPYRIEEHQLVKQIFFMKIFFPMGGFFKWDFDSPEVKTRLRAILHKFVMWQDNPRTYIEDIKNYGVYIEPLWRGLSSALDSYEDGFMNNRKLVKIPSQ
ncbi:MAG: hypothetical protein C4291_12520 [Candidatus Dadabacteria bacterium]